MKKIHKKNRKNNNQLALIIAANTLLTIPHNSHSQNIESVGDVSPVINGSNFEATSLIYVGRFSNGELHILDGAKLKSSEIDISSSLGVQGIVSIIGKGSFLENSGDLNIGYRGQGSLLISEQGELKSRRVLIGLNSGSSGALELSGINSKATINTLLLGPSGTGFIAIKDGASLDADRVSLGSGPGSFGEISITGPNSTLSTGLLTVGQGGVGSLKITNQASVTTSGNTNIGTDPQADPNLVSTVIVDGQNSKWQVNAILNVSTIGKGLLHIDNNGTVNTKSSINIGRDTGGNGTILISNGGNLTTSGLANIGQAGTGTMIISQGGTVNTGLTNIGVMGNSNTSTVTVQGTGSKWTTGTIYIGGSETSQGSSAIPSRGSIEIESGGSVSSGMALIASMPNTVGQVEVKGLNSEWRTNDLIIGRLGNGKLSIQDQGSVISTKFTLGASLGGTGVLEITGNKNNGYGVLETSQIIRGESTGEININGGILKATANQPNYLFNFNSISLGANGLIFDTQNYNIGISTGLESLQNSDSLFIKKGSGTLLVSGSNTYSGISEIHQGILKAGKTNTLSNASSYNIYSGAILDLDSKSQSVLSLKNSGTIKISSNAFNTPSTILKVSGPYEGLNGLLLISTRLAEDGSASDKLILSGANASASGTTSIQVTNARGLGALTTDAGIPVVVTENGASLLAGSFTLAGEHIDAGAYEYRLYQTSQGAVLRTNAPVPEPEPEPEPNPDPDPDPDPEKVPEPSPNPAYRSEVPLLSSLSAQQRQADMGMLGNLHKRLGDEGPQQIANASSTHKT